MRRLRPGDTGDGRLHGTDGPADGPPTLSGVPLIDLKAGDEVYAGVMMALLERAETGKGSRIDVSMLQAAASWLITTLPLLDFNCDPSEITRCGNEHRKFIPTNVYPTADGFIYMAIGSDVQWRRLTEIPTSLRSPTPCAAPTKARPRTRSDPSRHGGRDAAAHHRRDRDRLPQGDHPPCAHPRHSVRARDACGQQPTHDHANTRRQDHPNAAHGGGFSRRDDRTELPRQVRPGHHDDTERSGLHCSRLCAPEESGIIAG